MTILEHDNTYPKIICDNCKTILGYTTKDIISEMQQIIIESKIIKMNIKYLVCPRCKHKIFLKI